MPGGPRVQLVIDLAQAEISAQVAEAVGLDGVAVGVCVLGVALAGIVFAGATASPHLKVFDGPWGLVLVAFFLSAAVAFASTWIRVKAGPELHWFRPAIDELTGHDALGMAQDLAADELELVIGGNRLANQIKEGLLGFAVVLLPVIAGIYVLSLLRLLGTAILSFIGLAVFGLFALCVWMSFTWRG